jgi:DNA repair exonuclease SbcCD ATPase subunit
MANNEMVKPATPTAMMDRGANYSAKQKRLEKDEKELEELMKAHAKGDSNEEQEPDSETVEDTEVQVESDTEQEETPVEKEETQEDLDPEERTFKKRYGDLRRHMQEKEKEWEGKLKELMSKLEDKSPPTSKEEKLNREIVDLKAQVEELMGDKSAAERNKAEDVIRASHNDFDELKASDKFHDWVEEQPKWVRDAVYENSDDPKSVIRVIDLFKVDNGLTPSAKKQKTKDAAKVISKQGKPSVDASGAEGVIRESDVAKMSDQEFDDKYDMIQKAMREGKFVYDVSTRR